MCASGKSTAAVDCAASALESERSFAAVRSLALRDPVAGGAAVHRLFYRPELQRRRHRDDSTLSVRVGDFLASARRSSLSRPLGRVSRYEWPGSGDVRVLLVHGWTSQAVDWLLPARTLHRAGASVVAYDHPAHGFSDGSVTSLPDCVDALSRMLTECGPFDAVIAHSGGGAILATTLAGLLAPAPPTPTRLALLAPPASLRATMVRFAERYDLTGTAFPEFEKCVDDENGRPTDDFDVARALASLDADILHVLGTQDEEIAQAESLAIRGRLPLAKRMDASANHAGLLVSRAVIRELASFVLGNR